MSDFELHRERLATTDEKGWRVYLYPAEVRGFFRKWRTRVQFGLIVFFLLLPWVKIDGRQALLINVADRHFEIFGLTLKAHNAPLLFLVLAMAGFGLFFATAIWGRVWCGWACPQTVFIEAVYRRIERWVEGSALERRRLAAAPWSVSKASKRTLKWTLFLLASLIITHSFLAYFVGTEQLAQMVTRKPSENWASFLFIVFSTGIILFDFAWFREQFCIIACPYGRFQSVLMDDHSMVVAYDAKRGEPRSTPEAKALAKSTGAKLGDCVNCYRCVQVCPTGIDIRRGVQMECVACTSCIDACDEVMTKLKKPTGLIRYDSQLEMAGQPRKRLRARTAVYLGIVLAAGAALTLSVIFMRPVDIVVLRAKETPYSIQKLADGSDGVVNHFKIELSNQSGAKHWLEFALDEALREKGAELITAIRPLPVESDKVIRADVFVRFPKSLLVAGKIDSKMIIKDRDDSTGDEDTISKEVTLVGPFN